MVSLKRNFSFEGLFSFPQFLWFLLHLTNERVLWLLFAESPGFNFCTVWMKIHSLEVYTTLSFPVRCPGGHIG